MIFLDFSIKREVGDIFYKKTDMGESIQPALFLYQSQMHRGVETDGTESQEGRFPVAMHLPNRDLILFRNSSIFLPKIYSRGLARSLSVDLAWISLLA